MSNVDTVLKFWFGNAVGETPPAETQKTWWTKSPTYDAQVRTRFEDLHTALMAGEHADWLDAPRGALARIIVLDQFSRNMFRDDPRAFASDSMAVATTDHVLERGYLTQLGPHEQLFALMPLMHAESAQRQAQSIEQFGALAERVAGHGFENNLDYAHQHARIIDRFGRYPHRNAILGRTSTPEEIEFLKKPGSSF